MTVSLPTHICVTRPQWVNHYWYICIIYDMSILLYIIIYIYIYHISTIIWNKQGKWVHMQSNCDGWGGDWWWYKTSVQNPSSTQIAQNAVPFTQIVSKFCTELTSDYCRILSNMSKRLVNWEIHFVQMRFREIWILDAFRMDILHCIMAIVQGCILWRVSVGICFPPVARVAGRGV